MSISTPPLIAHENLHTPNHIKPGRYLCYINGLRVPVVNVTVRYGVGEPPTCEVQLFPSKHLQRLGAGDTVEVQVFYLDVHYQPHAPKFRLLFDGFIVGWNYSSSPEGRAINFSAAADLSKLHQARVEYLSTVDAISSFIAASSGSSNIIPNIGVFNAFRLLRTGLDYPEDKQKEVTIKRPFEFLLNTILAISSTQIPKQMLTIPVVNYFARFVRRRNLINRIVAMPFFDDVSTADNKVFPLLKAAQSEALLAEIGAAVSSQVGQAGSLMDVLEGLFVKTFYELAMLPTAPAVRTKLDGLIVGGALADRDDRGGARYRPLRLAQYYAKPQSLFSMAPRCNVLFPSQITNISYTEHYLTQPTRLYAYDQFAAAVTGANTAPVTRDVFCAAYPPDANTAMEARNELAANAQSQDPSKSESATVTGKNILVWPEEFFKGPVPSYVETPYILGLMRTILSNTAPEQEEVRRSKILSYTQLFAQYEYYRQRYSNRGGAADLTFNPYLVPGYSCVLFDHRGSGYDQVGYLINVVHVLSKGRMYSAVNYSHGRTLQEFSADLKHDCEQIGRKLGAAPREVIDGVRQGLQDPERADAIYREMFYPGPAGLALLTPGPVAVNPLDLMQYTDDNSKPVVLGDTEKVAPKVMFSAEPTAADPRSADVSSIRPDVPLKPREEYEGLFFGQDAAMTYTARPICTLEEYVQFVHGENPEAVAQQTVEKLIDVGIPGLNIKYYDKLFDRPVNTGRPTAAETGTSVVQPPGQIATVATLNNGNAVPTSVPYNAVAYDWSAALLKYRDEIETSQALIE